MKCRYLATLERFRTSWYAVRTDEAVMSLGQQDAPARFGRYLVLERIGAGGMGEVFKVREGAADGAVDLVLKRLHPQAAADPQIVAMFRREGRLASMLRHPNLVRLVDQGESPDGPYLVMEFVDGCTIGCLLGKGGPLAWPLALHVARGVASALHHLHGLADDEGRPLRIVHRDLSPSNVMVTGEGRVRLLDLGIAKPLALSELSTMHGHFRGKLGYMAPEQLAGEPLDERVDQYQLGVMLYEMLTGRRLFPSRGQHLAALYFLRQASLQPPSTLAPSVPASLDQLVLRLLHPDRDRRFACFGGVLDALTALQPDGAGREAELAALCREARAEAPPSPSDPIPPTLTATVR
jgi:serine/threonine protein kinase